MTTTARSKNDARPLVACILASLAVLLSVSVEGTAQQPRVEIEPYVGGFFTEDLDFQELDNAPIYGARLGFRLARGLWVESQVGFSPIESSVEIPGAGEQPFDVDALLYEGGLAYTFPVPGPLKPFLGAAAGAVRFDPDVELLGSELESETSFSASIGAGLRLGLGVINLRADVRDHIIRDPFDEARQGLPGDFETETIHAIEASAGISLILKAAGPYSGAARGRFPRPRLLDRLAPRSGHGDGRPNGAGRSYVDGGCGTGESRSD